MKIINYTFKRSILWSCFLGLGLFGFQQTQAQITCQGGPTSAADSHMESLSLIGENGTSIDYTWPTANLPNNGPLGVENQTAQVVQLIPGQTYTVEFNLWARGVTQYASNGAIWIDFNGDGQLAMDEMIHQTPPGNTLFVTGGGWNGANPTGGVSSSSTFTVPANANAGTIGMRAMQQETTITPLNPCASFNWGSMVDFTVELVSGLDCDIVCPVDIAVSNDPGECGAYVSVPQPELVGTACGDMSSSIVMLNENFNSCVQPTGWTNTTTSTGSTTPGACLSALFSYSCTANGPAQFWYNNPGYPTNFDGCFALIDDDVVGSGAEGVHCIESPVLDLSAGGVELVFDFLTRDYLGNGVFLVEGWNGSSWELLFSQGGVVNGSQQSVDLSGFNNSDFQVRFCYDDEGSWAYGAAFDNVMVTAIDPNADPDLPPIVNDYNGTENASDFYPVGTTTVTFSADGVGSCQVNITVEDNETPLWTNCPEDFEVSSTTCCKLEVNWEVPTATDNCGSVNISQTSGPENGSVLSAGTYIVEYEAIDSSGNISLCSFEIIVSTFCLSLESHVYLEGALLDPATAGEYLSEMRANLNSSRVLPGQSYFSFLFGLNYTEPGQPYDPEPWNYFGEEGAAFDSEGDLGNSSAGYASTVVDWVLVTLRPGSSPASPAVWRTAALLHKDGSVELLRSLPCCALDEASSYYLMIQHRNHLPVMSHEALQFEDGTLTYDFRSQDSYIFDIFGFGAIGQKEVESGVYAMFAGNGDQTLANQSEIEINFNDKQRFDEDLGIQQQYSIGDYNLDGNVQFNDKLVLIENLGSQSSVSPMGSVVTSEMKIDCGSAELNGSLVEGEEAEEVWIEISYTSGCGEYGGQEIPSEGVEGLTATLESGVFEEEEGGVLMLSISGTPDSGGTAVFLLNIAGEICNLEIEVDFIPSYPPGTVHCDPDNPTELVEVTNPATGDTWMDRNLGASQAATASNDPDAYGDLFQWGRFADGHQCRDSETNTTQATTAVPLDGNTWDGEFIVGHNNWLNSNNTDIWQGVNGENNPCPSGYRVPTEAELNAERLSWSSNNTAGAFASPLKLPVAGGRSSSNGSLLNVGTIGRYWSSTVSSTNSPYLFFNSSNAAMNGYSRANGSSVRCLKDESPAQGSIESIDCGSAVLIGSITEGEEADGVSSEIPYTGGNGGSHDGQTVISTGVTGLTATLAAGNFETGSGTLVYEITGTPASAGTASFAIEIGGENCTLEVEVEEADPEGYVHCGDPTEVVEVTNPATGETWMDRNLGASQAATASNDPDAYGDLFQWGRFADGHQCRDSETNTTQATTAVPLDGNTWDGEFIIGHDNWLNSNNSDLWQGVNGENNPCPSGYRLPTEAELNAERLSWSSNNGGGAFDSPLKLPMAGRRNNGSGSLSNVGTRGGYWSSTVSSANSRYLYFDSSIAYMNGSFRALGNSVRCLKDESPAQGSIESIDCESAVLIGSLTEGEEADGVSSEIPYTGGNGGSHDGQTVNSTGVTGLTATLAAGSFETGSGTLTYEITGTPASAGTASFAIEIGGETCTLEVEVEEADPEGYVHCGDPTEVVEVTNPATGETWMDRNLGASQAATASNDPDAYGDLFQWGRFADGHQCRDSETNTTQATTAVPLDGNPWDGDFIITHSNWLNSNNTDLWQEVNGENNPCPSGYRVPTEAELNAERLSWSSNNTAGAFASPLKLPMAGLRFYGNGSLANVGTDGYYWSSTVSSSDSRILYFYSSDAFMLVHYRAFGKSVRCLKDESPAQGSIESIDCGSAVLIGSLTEGEEADGVSSEIPYTGGNGGSHDGQSVNSTGVTGLTATLAAGSFETGSGTLTYEITGTPASAGTASFAIEIGGETCTLEVEVEEADPEGYVHCGDPTEVVQVTNPATGDTWMDRNLGASQAATASNDPDAYGDLFQWGRFADGHQCRNSETNTTQATSAVPLDGNPWDGGFIIGHDNWLNSNNTDLWQGVNGENNPCPSGYRLPTEAELNAERLSWSSNNATGAFDSPLKLPVAGVRFFSDGSLNHVGTSGGYWSSGLSSTNSRLLHFVSWTANMNAGTRASGYSVRCLKDESPGQGSIESIDCGSAVLIGSITEGEEADGVSSEIPYTGGNGGSHDGQSINSTGVTGLTATLAAGNFETGSGTLTYEITGTPASAGTASFAIEIGGETCTLEVEVEEADPIGPSYPEGYVHCGDPTEVVEVTNPATGDTWMDRNLGASQVATASNDQDAYGDLYQWGRFADGHQCRESETNTTQATTAVPLEGNPWDGEFIIGGGSWLNSNNTDLWQEVNGENNPCPSGYRVPTEAELNAERLSWSSNNAAGAIASPLKLPMAGVRYNIDGLLFNVGSNGYYWSSTVSVISSRGLFFNGSLAYMIVEYRAWGFSVRCLKD